MHPRSTTTPPDCLDFHTRRTLIPIAMDIPMFTDMEVTVMHQFMEVTFSAKSKNPKEQGAPWI